MHPSDCPFCLNNNLLKTPLVAHTDGAFLTPALGSISNYLIVPKQHIESPIGLPKGWWADVAALLPKVPGLSDHYNIAMNVGAQAGQSVRHLHFWIIPRAANHAATGKGLARLIDEAASE